MQLAEDLFVEDIVHLIELGSLVAREKSWDLRTCCWHRDGDDWVVLVLEDVDDRGNGSGDQSVGKPDECSKGNVSVGWLAAGSFLSLLSVCSEGCLFWVHVVVVLLRSEGRMFRTATSTTADKQLYVIREEERKLGSGSNGR